MIHPDYEARRIKLLAHDPDYCRMACKPDPNTRRCLNCGHEVYIPSREKPWQTDPTFDRTLSVLEDRRYAQETWL